jgi:hypothetical protein
LLTVNSLHYRLARKFKTGTYQHSKYVFYRWASNLTASLTLPVPTSLPTQFEILHLQNYKTKDSPYTTSTFHQHRTNHPIDPLKKTFNSLSKTNYRQTKYEGANEGMNPMISEYFQSLETKLNECMGRRLNFKIVAAKAKTVFELENN